MEYEASLLGGKALITDELIEEVNFLIEHPTAVSGSFDVNYLNLPRDVLITTMMHHQRYFPVTDANGSLLPHFIGVRDGGTKGLDIVRQGYEKVLRARLADAQFFFNEDLKKPLEAYVEKLSGLLFQRDLGSMLDKTQRLVALTKRYCERANVDEATRNLALRTAWLCKADLVTSMVEEFTELQGVMGREYALRSGEDRRVAQAIYEHYLPRHANDELPSTLVGALVGIADRMDTLCACFDRSMIPTGSADPLGLRRAAHSIVVVLNELQLHFPLSSLIDDSLAVLSEVQLLTRPVDETKADVLDFLRMRIEALLDEWDIAYDIRDAVISVGFDDVPDVITRARALTNLKQRDATAFAEAVIAFTRVINILSKQRTDAPVNPELFVEDGERRLYDEFQQVIARISLPLRGRDESAYEDAFMKLATLKGAIDDFFGTAPGTGVLVMHPDERLRNNRLALVQTLEGVLKQIADFSKLIV
ncbi:MAG TPA: glycine--tRNA ligase subunit beta [Armatimonadetes bacterium]|nr:glycine--tRNA ligase subunit beta [Armatimonadota bacterium]